MLRCLIALVFSCVLLVAGDLSGAQAQSRREPGQGQLRSIDKQTVAPEARIVRFESLDRAGRVTSIRLSADLDCAIEKVTITYANGQIHYEDREIFLNAKGRRSAEIDPRFEELLIDTVEVRLKPQACAPNTQLVLLATQSEATVEQSKRRMAAPGRRRSIQAPPTSPMADTTEKSAEDKPYSEVDVHFGTTRQQEAPRKRDNVEMASFGTTPDPSNKLHLGRAVVTVPRDGRQPGQITRPEFQILSLGYEPEDIKKHFTILKVDVQDAAVFIAEAKSRIKTEGRLHDHAFVFVHGFNVGFDDAMFRAAQISYDMDFRGLTFAFSWPSRSSKYAYNADRERAISARFALRDFIQNVFSIMGPGSGKRIHFLAHSMGSQTLMDALSMFEAPAAGSAPLFGQIVFAASDVVRDSFRITTTRIAPLASGITLYASSKDWALTFSGILRAGESPVGLITRSGIPYIGPDFDSIDVSALDTDFFAYNHSTYGDRRPLIEDMGILFADSVRPPAQRSKFFERLSAPKNGGIYYRYLARQ